MFGLPWETTLIMGSAVLFWIAATLVFYFRTSTWNTEDADYDPAISDSDAEAEVDPTHPDGGVRS